MRCPECDHANDTDARFCGGCGAAFGAQQAERPDGFDWKWIVFGSVIITGTQYLILRVAWRLLFQGSEVELLGALMAGGLRSATVWLMVGLLAAGYVVGGLLIGRMSAGRTILEPALASSVPILLFLIQFLVRTRAEFDAGGRSTLVAIGLAVVLAVPCFFLAMLGGWLGEKWQDAVESP